MKTISAKAYYQTPHPPLLVDVRTPQEFQEAHIYQALSLPLADFEPEFLEKKIGGIQSVVVSCQSGGRASLAAQKLEKAGWDVSILEGSLTGWEAKGLPIVRNRPHGITLMRQVQIIIGTLNLAAALLTSFLHPSWIALNILIGVGLIFSGLTGFCGLGLLLAKMPWNRSSKPKNDSHLDSLQKSEE